MNDLKNVKELSTVTRDADGFKAFTIVEENLYNKRFAKLCAQAFYMSDEDMSHEEQAELIVSIKNQIIDPKDIVRKFSREHTKPDWKVVMSQFDLQVLNNRVIPTNVKKVICRLSLRQVPLEMWNGITLKERVDDYIKMKMDHAAVSKRFHLSHPELWLFLGVSKADWLNYGFNDEIKAVIDYANNYVESYITSLATDSQTKNTKGVEFIAKNHLGMHDEVHIKKEVTEKKFSFVKKVTKRE